MHLKCSDPVLWLYKIWLLVLFFRFGSQGLAHLTGSDDGAFPLVMTVVTSSIFFFFHLVKGIWSKVRTTAAWCGWCMSAASPHMIVTLAACEFFWVLLYSFVWFVCTHDEMSMDLLASCFFCLWSVLHCFYVHLYFWMQERALKSAMFHCFSVHRN
jgi:hypothetical protein